MIEMFREFCGVVMTADGKCIVRGRDKSKRLCLVDEKSRLRVYKTGIIKGIESNVNERFLGLSDEVKKYYGIEKGGYFSNKDKIGELKAVKLQGIYYLEKGE